jgi:uncharacterized protein YqjF (DUF2071 family)
MTEIDRLLPARRPAGPLWGWQHWRKVLFMHWAVPVEAMRRAVPMGFELDLHDGVAYVGVVPFAMEGVRPSVIPNFAALNFLETNVRTYVIRNGEPGVYFFSLDAASRLAVLAARAGFALPYYYASIQMQEAEGAIRYTTTRAGTGVRHEVRYKIGAALGASQVGTLEHFLIERYLLFTEHRGSIRRGQVHHLPYSVHGVEVTTLHDELVAAAGLPPVSGPPLHAHYSPGVDVEIFALGPA